MDKHQIKGRVREAAGKIKEETGEALDDRTLRTKGVVEKGVGKIQSKYGDLKSDIESDPEDEDLERG
jgi:uncharacterized protein YjbJ (UPF0337 family)